MNKTTNLFFFFMYVIYMFLLPTYLPTYNLEMDGCSLMNIHKDKKIVASDSK